MYAVLALVLSAPTIAAPVPRPVQLTDELVVGTWDYSWGQWPDGAIVFNKDGTYGAQHVQGSEIYYAGTWTLRGDTVTLTEFAFGANGELRTGPAIYAFKFDVKGYPSLKGVSNGSTCVALQNPKRN